MSLVQIPYETENVTVDQSVTPASGGQPRDQILNMFAHQLQVLGGTTHWYDSTSRPTGGGTAGVGSISGVSPNTAGGDVALTAGSGITITPNNSADTVTIAATGGGGGYTPPWVVTGTGSHYAAWGDGNPGRGAEINYLSTNNVTPTQIGTTTGRLVKFRLPKQLVLSNAYIYCSASSSTNYRLGIYTAASGGALIWDSGTFTSLSSAWRNIAISSGTLSASTDYWLAWTVASTSTNQHIPTLTNNFGSAAPPFAGLSSGVPEFAQITLSSAGVFPSTLPTVSTLASTNGTVPVVHLVGTAS